MSAGLLPTLCVKKARLHLRRARSLEQCDCVYRVSVSSTRDRGWKKGTRKKEQGRTPTGITDRCCWPRYATLHHEYIAVQFDLMNMPWVSPVKLQSINMSGREGCELTSIMSVSAEHQTFCCTIRAVCDETGFFDSEQQQSIKLHRNTKVSSQRSRREKLTHFWQEGKRLVSRRTSCLDLFAICNIEHNYRKSAILLYCSNPVVISWINDHDPYNRSASTLPNAQGLFSLL